MDCQVGAVTDKQAGGQASPPWQPSTRLVAAVLLIVLAALLAYALQTALIILMAAVVLAYLLHPLVSRFQRHLHFPRWLAVASVYAVFLALLTALAAGLGLAVSQQMEGLVSDLQYLSRLLPELLDQAQEAVLVLGPWSFSISRETLQPLLSPLTSAIQPLLSGTGQAIGSLVGATASTIGQVVIVLVVGFYLLLDYRMVDRSLVTLTPEPYQEDVQRLTRQTELIWQAFLRGQLGLSLAVGMAVAILLSLLGVRFSLGLGLIAGVLEFVPGFGPLISAALAGLVALFQGENWLGLSPLAFAMLVVGVMSLVQLVENNYLVPRFIGVSLRLHPIVVLVAVVAGASVAGLLGVLIAAPAAATLRLWLGYVYFKVVGLEGWPSPSLEPRRQTRRLLARLRRPFGRPKAHRRR
jgi:predicted PurR-regulated permease PerM